MGIKQDILFKVAKRWIAGKELEEAVVSAQSANAKRIGAIINYLGEEVSELSTAEEHAEEYLKIQREISERGVEGCVSVKLTQVGLCVAEEVAIRKMEQLAKHAESLNQFLWMDMEGSKYTDKTLEIYSSLLATHRNVGVALQAYMRRSERDLGLLAGEAKIRLVKGAYREPSEVVFASRSEVRENFAKLMATLFERGSFFAIATHDSELITRAKRLAESFSTSFEFEMLKGIRDELKEELVSSGYRVADYIPYGGEWYRYSMRRIREHPGNVWLLLRSFF